MKRTAFILSMLLASVLGCKAQIPSNPNASSCPSVNTGTWTALETSATEITTTSLNDTSVTQGTWCYAVTAIINTQTPILQSVPSNVFMAVVPSGTSENLIWQAPASGPVPTGYVMYRIAAIQTTLAAPSSLN